MNTVDLVLRLIDAFENAGVPYMLSGAIAASYYGSPSMTNGAQFVVQISGDQLVAVQRTLGDEFKLDPQMSIDSATMAMRYILEHSPTGFAFDLFLLGPDAHDQARFERRREVPFEGTRVCMPTAEDVVVANLRWARATGDHVANPTSLPAAKLDLNYIRRWTDQHGTRALFDQLLRQTQGVS